jgi:hypothetical protein
MMKEFGENSRSPQPERPLKPVEDNTLDKSSLNFKGFFNREVRRSAEAILRTAQTADASLAEDPAEAETPLQVFGVLVGAQRRKLHLTVEELAGRTGLQVSLLNAIELGALPFEQVVDLLPSVGEALGGKYTELSRVLANLTLGE